VQEEHSQPEDYEPPASREYGMSTSGQSSVSRPVDEKRMIYHNSDCDPPPMKEILETMRNKDRDAAHQAYYRYPFFSLIFWDLSGRPYFNFIYI
jgi:hypothetical protein